VKLLALLLLAAVVASPSPGRCEAAASVTEETEEEAPKRRPRAAERVLAETRNHLAYPHPDQATRGDHRFAMSLLLGWGAGSTLVGTMATVRGRPAAGAFPDDPLFWAGIQHAAWGAIDLGLGAAGLGRSDSLAGRLKPPTNTQLARVYWINAALDVAYLGFAVAALLLAERSERWSPFWRGTGEAVLVQAGFLLAYDLAMGLRFSFQARRARRTGAGAIPPERGSTPR
jgi:hypothetical protein